MHQERTGHGEHAALADSRRRWRPGGHWPQVKSGERWPPRVSDPCQRWRLPGPQSLLPQPEVSGFEGQWLIHRDLEKRCFLGCGHFCGTPEPDVQLTLQTSGLEDERHPSGHEWGRLPLQGLPDDAAQLWMHCQGDLVKAPGRLVEGRRWKVWCSGKPQPHQSGEDDH